MYTTIRTAAVAAVAATAVIGGSLAVAADRPSGDRATRADMPGPAAKTLARNKAIVKRFNLLAFRDDRDAEALELVGDYVNYEAGGVTTDRTALERFLAFSGANDTFVVTDLIAERDMVTIRYEVTLNGTPQIGVDIYQVKNGRIVGHWDAIVPPQMGGNP